MCGLTAVDTSLTLLLKGKKKRNGYCKLTADEWKYNLLASPGQGPITCRSRCTPSYYKGKLAIVVTQWAAK